MKHIDVIISASFRNQFRRVPIRLVPKIYNVTNCRRTSTLINYIDSIFESEGSIGFCSKIFVDLMIKQKKNNNHTLIQQTLFQSRFVAWSFIMTNLHTTDFFQCQARLLLKYTDACSFTIIIFFLKSYI